MPIIYNFLHYNCFVEGLHKIQCRNKKEQETINILRNISSLRLHKYRNLMRFEVLTAVTVKNAGC